VTHDPLTGGQLWCDGVLYTVVTVSDPDCSGVRRGHVTVTQPYGYLSNFITESRGYGSFTCPWRIELQRGERINITLIDFTTPRYARREPLPATLIP